MALAWSPVDNQTSTTGATRTNTVPAGGVPIGALLVCLVVENANAVAGTGTIADAGGNTYTNQLAKSHNNVQANGFSAVYTAPVTTALTSAQLITYTKAVSGSTMRLLTGYITGQDTSTPVDTTASAAASGSSSNPSVTSGTPAQSAPMYVGLVGAATTASTGTFPGSWTLLLHTTVTVPTEAGWILGTGTTPQTFNPTYGATRAWSALILVVNPPIGGGGVTVKPLSALGVG